MRNSNEKERRGNEIEAVWVAMRDPNQLRNKKWNSFIEFHKEIAKRLPKNFKIKID